MTPDDRAQLAQLGAHEMLIEAAREEARTRLDMLPFRERDRVMDHLVGTRPDLVIEAVRQVEHSLGGAWVPEWQDFDESEVS